jgi:hypothetical protein
MVDGQSQVRRWRAENMDPHKTPEQNVQWESRPEFDFVSATYSDGYGDYRLFKPENAAVTTDVTHKRSVLFVKPDYWIVFDEITSPSPHRYQWLFHTSPGIQVSPTGAAGAVLLAGSKEQQLLLQPHSAQPIQMQVMQGSESPIQGWYSTGHQRKIPSNAIIIENKKCTSLVIAILLYPYATDHGISAISFERIETTSRDCHAYVVQTEMGTDYVMFSNKDGEKTFGPFRSRGHVACIRRGLQGKVSCRFDHP